MRINKMTSYGIRLINRMAVENRRITSKELQEMEGIPHGVLVKVMGELRNAGLIVSYQGRGGSGGGFELGKKREDISLYQVIKAMEKEVTLDPEMDREFYRGEKKSLYERLEAVNREYISRLEQLQLYGV